MAHIAISTMDRKILEKSGFMGAHILNFVKKKAEEDTELPKRFFDSIGKLPGKPRSRFIYEASPKKITIAEKVTIDGTRIVASFDFDYEGGTSISGGKVTRAKEIFRSTTTVGLPLSIKTDENIDRPIVEKNHKLLGSHIYIAGGLAPKMMFYFDKTLLNFYPQTEELNFASKILDKNEDAEAILVFRKNMKIGIDTTEKFFYVLDPAKKKDIEIEVVVDNEEGAGKALYRQANKDMASFKNKIMKTTIDSYLIGLFYEMMNEDLISASSDIFYDDIVKFAEKILISARSDKEKTFKDILDEAVQDSGDKVCRRAMIIDMLNEEDMFMSKSEGKRRIEATENIFKLIQKSDFGIENIRDIQDIIKNNEDIFSEDLVKYVEKGAGLTVFDFTSTSKTGHEDKNVNDILCQDIFGEDGIISIEERYKDNEKEALKAQADAFVKLSDSYHKTGIAKYRLYKNAPLLFNFESEDNNNELNTTQQEAILSLSKRGGSFLYLGHENDMSTYEKALEVSAFSAGENILFFFSKDDNGNIYAGIGKNSNSFFTDERAFFASKLKEQKEDQQNAEIDMSPEAVKQDFDKFLGGDRDIKDEISDLFNKSKIFSILQPMGEKAKTNFLSTIKYSVFDIDKKKIKDTIGNEIKTSVYSYLNTDKRQKSLEEKTKNISLQDVVSVFSTIAMDEKVFPNIHKLGAPDVSLRNIISSPFLTMNYMKIKALHGPIRELIIKEGGVPPDVRPYEFSLTDPEKNKLPEDEKDIEMDINNKNGILSLKLFPTVIDIEREEDKEVFIEISANAIARATGENDINGFKKELLKSKGFKEALKSARRVLLKSETVIDGTVLEKRERYVLVDEENRELPNGVLNIPVYDFFEEVKSRGLIKKEFRVKEVSFKEEDIDNVIDGIMKNMLKMYQKEKNITALIRKNYEGLVNKVNEINMPENNRGFSRISENILKLIDRKRFSKEIDEIKEALNKDGVLKYLAEGMVDKEKNVNEVVSYAFKKRFGDNPLTLEQIQRKQDAVELVNFFRSQEDIKNKISISTQIKKTGLSQAIAKFMKEKVLTPAEIVKEAYERIAEKLDRQFSLTEVNKKKDIEKYVKYSFVGNEHHFYKNKEFPAITREIIKNSILNNTDDEFSTLLSKEIVEIMMEESSKDFNIEKAAITSISGFAYLAYVTSIKQRYEKEGKAIPFDVKKQMLKAFLDHVFMLRPHQTAQTMGVLAAYLSGQVSTFHRWWLMRTGKTSEAIATSVLTGWATGSNSLYFIQKKNFLDILDQHFRIFPLMMKHNTVVLGPNKKYNIDSAKMPISITEMVFKNIPVSLKQKKLKNGKPMLQNPLKNSSKAPAEAISETFVQDMESMIDISKGMSEEDFDNILKANRDLVDPLFMKDVEKSWFKENQKSLNKAFYFYVLKLVREKFISPIVKGSEEYKEIAKIYTTFWAEYKEEFIKKEANNSIVFIGKQYLTSFGTSEKEELSYKPKIKGGIAFKSDLDIEADSTIYDRIKPKEIMNTINALDPSFVFEKRQEDYALIPFVEIKNGSDKQRRDIAESIGFDFLSKLNTEFRKRIDALQLEEIEKKVVFKELGYVLLDAKTRVFPSLINRKQFLGEDSSTIGTNKIPYLLIDDIEATGLNVPMQDLLKDRLFTGESFNNRLLSSKEAITEAEKIEKVVEVFKDVFTGNIDEKAKMLTESGYRVFAREFITPGGVNGLKTSIINRIERFGGGRKRRNSIQGIFHYKKDIEEFFLPARENNGEVVLASIKTKAKVLKKEDPSISENRPIYPRKVIFNAVKGGDVSISLLEAVSIEDGKVVPYTRERKKYVSSLQASFLWSIDEDGIKAKAINTDETHKSVTGKAKTPTAQISKANGYCDVSKYKFLDTQTGIYTGTPFAGNMKNFSYLLTATSSASKKTSVDLSKEMVKFCGNYKIYDPMVGFFVATEYHNKLFEKISTKALASVIKKINSKNVNVNIYEEAKDFVKNFTSNNDLYESFYDYRTQNGYESTIEIEEVIISIEKLLRATAINAISEIKKAAKEKADAEIKERRRLISESGKTGEKLSKEEIVKIREHHLAKELKTTTLGVEMFEDAIVNNSKLSRPAAGLSNPSGMANATTFVDGASIDIRSLGEKSQYIIRDKDLETGERDFSRMTPMEKTILGFEAIMSKYRRDYNISKVATILQDIYSLAEKVIREESKHYLGLNNREINTLLNKTQSKKKDSMMDDISNLIRKGISIPQHRQKAFEIMNKIVRYIVAEAMKDINELKQTLDENEEAKLIVDEDGNKKISITVKKEHIQKIENTVAINGVLHNIAIYDDIYNSPEDLQKCVAVKTNQFVALGDDGVHIAEAMPINRKTKVFNDQKLKYYTELKLKPYKEIPEINASVNIAFDDDKAVISMIAASEKLKEQFTDRVNKLKNTRIVTSRTEVTKMMTVNLLKSLIDRDDISVKQVLLLNTTSDELKKLVATLNKDTDLAYIMEERNIELRGIEVNDLELIVDDEILSKGHKLHFIGDIESSAEGVRMDYIQEGFFIANLGKVDPNIIAQSTARQVGDLQSKSIVNYFGGGNVYSKIEVGKKGRHKGMLDYMEEGLIIGDSLYKEQEAYEYVFGADSPITDNGAEALPASHIVGSKKAERNVREIATVVTGEVPGENIAAYTDSKKKEAIKEMLSTRTTKIALQNAAEAKKEDSQEKQMDQIETFEEVYSSQGLIMTQAKRRGLEMIPVPFNEKDDHMNIEAFVLNFVDFIAEVDIRIVDLILNVIKTKTNKKGSSGQIVSADEIDNMIKEKIIEEKRMDETFKFSEKQKELYVKKIVSMSDKELSALMDKVSQMIDPEWNDQNIQSISAGAGNDQDQSIQIKVK